MKPSYRQISRLVAGLTLILLAIGGEAAKGPVRANGPALSIIKIGPLAVGKEIAKDTAGASLSSSLMRQREPLAFDLSSPLPPRMRLYVLVRATGDRAWTVEPVAQVPGFGTASGVRTTQVELGLAGDLGKRFEVQIIAAGESMPALLSDDMRAQVVHTSSPVVEVERRNARPSVSITEVLATTPAGLGPSPPDPQYVYGDDELIVHDESLVGLAARDLPAGSRVGVAVQPASTDERWVMDDFLLTGRGSVKAHFGAGDGSEQSFHYEVSAFVADGDDWPPAGSAIAPAEWQRYQTHFLAESRSVRVVRWQRELRIEKIGDAPIQPGRILIADRQVDVRGAAKRSLAPGERIWLICVPLQGDPWIARSTSRLSLSGHWSMKAVQLVKVTKPEPFDILAVVSADDLSKIRPEALRWWLDGAEAADSSTRVAVLAAGTGMP